MLFAVLGTDEEIIQLLAAAISEGHQIAWLGDVRAADAAEIRRLAPHLEDRAAGWELLLDQAIADAVLVGRGSATAELRAEQLKRLAASAVPVLAVHPICDSVLTYYELDMIRRETGAVLRHYNPIADHPVLAKLNSWVRDGYSEIGPIHQVTCERRLKDASRAECARASAPRRGAGRRGCRQYSPRECNWPTRRHRVVCCATGADDF